MSIPTEFPDLTPQQRAAVEKRYPDDERRTEYIYEISDTTGRFLCRHRKPRHPFISTSQKTK